MIEQSIKKRMEYYDSNITLYDTEINKKLVERVATYGEMEQGIAYLTEDKRALLCYNVVQSLSTHGFVLTDRYKDIIEYLISNKSVGIIKLPSVLYKGQSYSVKNHKMSYDTFLTAFFPFGGKMSDEEIIETYDSHRTFSKVVYSFYLLENNEDIIIRYASLPQSSK